jgi:hypothetical protein
VDVGESTDIVSCEVLRGKSNGKAIPFEISCISGFDSLRMHGSVDIQKWDQKFSNLYSTATWPIPNTWNFRQMVGLLTDDSSAHFFCRSFPSAPVTVLLFLFLLLSSERCSWFTSQALKCCLAINFTFRIQDITLLVEH